MSSLVSIRSLKVELMSVKGLVSAVRNINLDILSGEIHGIVGESGCGKSMTAKSILRLHDETKTALTGQIIFDGSKDILKMNKRELQHLRGKEISMIFQDPITTLNPLLTVGSQIMEMLTLHTNLSKSEAKQRSVALLERMGICPGEERFKQYPFEMSGGMLQRACIAMSLACNPRLLIADEPTTALDVTMQAQVLELLKELQREFNSSILIITHNFGVIAEICNRVSVMYAGQIVETGDVREIFYHPCHPYTQDLISSIPKSGERATQLVSIPGAPPPLNRPIIGCPYAPRCTRACDRCFREAPDMTNMSDTHRYLCFLDGNGKMREEAAG
ncbi:MAG: ABC transporter ATP-binding protein [Oscillospiraceae bacterium]